MFYVARGRSGVVSVWHAPVLYRPNMACLQGGRPFRYHAMGM